MVLISDRVTPVADHFLFSSLSMNFSTFFFKNCIAATVSFFTHCVHNDGLIILEIWNWGMLSAFSCTHIYFTHGAIGLD